MATTAKQNILQRINAAMKTLKYVQKTTKVTGGGSYMAVSHDEVAKAVHPAMARHGIVAVPSLVSENMAPSGMMTSNGNTIFLYQATYDVNFYGIDSLSEFVTARVSAHANDMSDKAPGKALSYAMKSAYLKVFCLESGEDEEQRVEGNPESLSDEQIDQLTALCDEFGFPPKETLLALATKVYRIEKIEDLSTNYFDNAVKRLKKKAADAKRAEEKKTPPKKTAPKKKAAPAKKAGEQTPEQPVDDEKDPFVGE